MLGFMAPPRAASTMGVIQGQRVLKTAALHTGGSTALFRVLFFLVFVLFFKKKTSDFR